jgi:flagellin-like hook-associated protein FlgL
VGGDFAANGGNTGTASMALVAGTSELSNLQDEYNQVLTQIDSLATDSGYKGKNLLAADTLTVKFEGTHTLDVVGFNASSGNLGITAATWTTGGSIDTDVTKLDAATSTLSQNSSKLSANLSIITTRQDFSTNMENTLTAGADKLTLADTNEEGANMLMLQTRQSLATTALSLSAQAAQSVLKLFQ